MPDNANPYGPLDMTLLEGHVAKVRELDDEIAGCAGEERLARLRKVSARGLADHRNDREGNGGVKNGMEELTFALLVLQEDKRILEATIKDLQVTQRASPSLRERQHCEAEIAILRLRIVEADAEIAEAERARERLGAGVPG